MQAKNRTSGLSDQERGPLLRPAKSMYPLSAELKLVVACSWIPRPESEAAQSARIAELCLESLDWNLFVSLVERHQVASISLNRMQKLAPAAMPQAAQNRLREMAFASWRHALSLAHELVNMLRAFEGKEIAAIPLKGNVLASKLYGDPGMRDVLDLDILIHREDLERADALLRDFGFSRVAPSPNVTPRQLAVLNRQTHHWVYANSQMSIEIHWRIFRWAEDETRHLWERSIEEEWMGLTIRQPDDAVLLLGLCDHGSQHRYNRLKWLSDIAVLIARSGDWDWAEVLQVAERLDLELPLVQAAKLVEELYGIELPLALAALVRAQPHADRLANEALACITDEDATPYSPKQELAGLHNIVYWLRRSSRLAWYSTHLRKGRSPLTRLQPVLIGVSDFEAFPLPDRLFWMYYVFRPVFWAVRCLRGR